MPLSVQSAQISVSWNTKYWNTEDLNIAKDDHNVQVSKSWSDGTGNGQANRVWKDQRSVNASSNDDIDLSGALTDTLGQIVNWTKLRAIFIDNLSGEDLKLESANSPAGLFGASGDFINIPPYSMFCLTSKAGWAITNDTADKLRIANYDSTTAATYNIRLLGSQ